jgi:hypothetical protein
MLKDSSTRASPILRYACNEHKKTHESEVVAPVFHHCPQELLELLKGFHSNWYEQCTKPDKADKL